MTSLPRLIPRETTYTAFASSPTRSLPKIYHVYPAMLPVATVVNRVNPLLPPPPEKRTTMLQTGQPHWHNEHRALHMKQKEYNRYHNAWARYYYGNPVEKEDYRSYMRTVLKQQMADRELNRKTYLVDRVQESDEALETDRQALVSDSIELHRKKTILKTFRDDNKKLMENHWSDCRKRKRTEIEGEREQLRHNPINWSCTLK